ncbi:thioredoxin domain-containing protein [Arthrobacter sp. Sr24]
MNRLAGEPSAYLRQHAHNPVAWQPFDDAAFAEAVERDVPIFLSVGYAACHWCHVMAGESFEDPAIGAYLNEHFVSIKVDREERPDVDDTFMAATQALSGQGGWPMSVFLTPDGRAFYAGTYFAPESSPGQPSFREVLAAVHEAWEERRELVESTANDLTETLSRPLWQVSATPVGRTPAGVSGVELEIPANPWPEATAAAVTAMAQAEDLAHGGLGSAPKFPPTPALEFLLRHAVADSPTAPVAAGVAGRTLGAMVRSAIFDRLGGGFARYSVTADWSEPHYEKMLYDNAGLLQALVHWIRLAEDTPGQEPLNVQHAGGIAPLSVAEARDAVRSTVAWLLTEMRLPSGAFASSLDADTVVDGVHSEGASYTWTQAELTVAALEHFRADHADHAEGADAAALVAEAAAMLTIGPHGSHPLHAGRELNAGEQATWERLKPALLAARRDRTMPARDDKVVASWNAMLMGAVAEAAMVLAEPEWLVAATELGEYLYAVHWDTALTRVSHNGRARGIKGLLEDYAACANGYLTLYAATGETRWFDFAGELVRVAEQEFIVDGVVLNHGSNGDGVSASARAGGAAAAVQGSRFADPFDNATAGGVALLAQAFTSWAAYTGSTRHRDLAGHLLATLPELARRAPRSAGGLLAVAEALQAGPLEVAVVGAAGTDREALVRSAWAAASPGMVIAVWDGSSATSVPLLHGRALADRAPLAYVCRSLSCARPVSSTEELRTLLR